MILPWIAVIIVYLGEKVQQVMLTRVLRDALEQAQAAAKALPPASAPLALPPSARVPTPPLSVPALPPPATTPPSSGPFAGAPPWFQLALHEIGFHETGDNQGIDRYVQMAHCGADGEPWCAIFANAMLEQAGVLGTRSPSSQSFRNDPNFVQLSGPALGAITVYWRGTPNSGLGHVGFYRGEDSSRVWTLGGNEDDMVQIEALPKSSGSFGLVGYWWPRSVPLPKSGPVLMPSGSPIQVQTRPSNAPATPTAPSTEPNGKQTRIIATMFGGQQSAYGGPINDNSPGVALPFRFTGERPRVRVTNVNSGATVDADIVDVGPWNINDPYWQTGQRPQSETGTDMTGRRTNKAGIDLTLAAAQAVQIDGKGLVDWEFINGSPSVT
jgi:uncharacterized protein (TIGR02594 family)